MNRSRILGVLFFIVFAVVSGRNVSAQVLTAGDIAFTGYISAASGTDTFSFVLLVNAPAGTVISFTDNGWLNPGVFRTGEQTATFTSSIALTAGREIVISGPSAGAATAMSWFPPAMISVGTVTGTMPSLSTSGDQVLAYQGSAAAPTFIAGIHANGYTTGLGDCGNTTDASWDPDCIDTVGGTVGNTSFSKKPATLTAGVSSLYLGIAGVNNSDPDNAVFNCTGPLTTPAQIRTAVNNQANWVKTNGTPPNLNLPSTCTYLGIPSAAEVDVGGRVMTADGSGIRGAIVTLTSLDGIVRTTVSSSLGYFRFTGVMSGETYVVGVASKRYVIAPRTVVIADELNDLDLIAQ